MSKNKIKVEEMEGDFWTWAPDTDPSKTQTLSAISSCGREGMLHTALKLIIKKTQVPQA